MQAILDATARQDEPIQELLVTHGKVCWGHSQGACLPSGWYSCPSKGGGVCCTFDFAPLLDGSLAC